MQMLICRRWVSCLVGRPPYYPDDASSMTIPKPQECLYAAPLSPLPSPMPACTDTAQGTAPARGSAGARGAVRDLDVYCPEQPKRARFRRRGARVHQGGIRVHQRGTGETAGLEGRAPRSPPGQGRSHLCRIRACPSVPRRGPGRLHAAHGSQSGTFSLPNGLTLAELTRPCSSTS